MTKKKFCALCDCKDHSDIPGGASYKCPLVGRICNVCCQYEFDGGLGAQDTARDVYKLSGRRGLEAYAVCRACPHGGSRLDEMAVSIGREVWDKIDRKRK